MKAGSIRKAESSVGPVSKLHECHFRHFNAAAVVDAARGYRAHRDAGGKRLINLAGLFLFLVFLPSVAQAHPGHVDSGLKQGLAHPLTGLDHLLAMLAVGLWAAQQGGRARWLLPACFVAVMTIGGWLGVVGTRIPFMEATVLASVFILGLALATSSQAPPTVSCGIAGLFAFAHGHAHGAELTQESSGWSYGLGFALATVGLHAVGFVLGRAAMRGRRELWLRITGLGISGAGLYLMVNR